MDVQALFGRVIGPQIWAAYIVSGALIGILWTLGVAHSEDIPWFLPPMLLPVPVAAIILATLALVGWRMGGTAATGTKELVKGFASRALRENVQEYIDKSEMDIRKLISDLRKGRVELKDAQYRMFIEILFATKFPYYGVDSSLPSEFQKRHPSFLAAHASKLSREPAMVHDYRVLMHSADALKDDAKNDRYTDFFDWHEEHHVNLFYLPRAECESIMRDHDVNPSECTLGIAIWGFDFAMLFSAGTNPKVESAKLTIVEKDNPRFESIITVCNEIRDRASRVARSGAFYNLKGSFSQQWHDYVDPAERWKRIRPFMLHHLGDCKTRDRMILDAASGLGFEFFRLREEGFIVDANEVMQELREAGKEYGQKSKSKIHYEPTGHTWGRLATMGWENRYGAVLVIGNSIRTMEAAAQQESINTFYSLLKEGGTLVIDERNYDLIEKNSGVINACGAEPDSRAAFQKATGFDRTHNALYHGTNIRSVPFKTLEGGGYAVTYYENTGDIGTLRQARAKGLQEWEFHHPIPLDQMLKEAGFGKVEKFVDYDQDHMLEEGGSDLGASMYVYVATKQR